MIKTSTDCLIDMTLQGQLIVEQDTKVKNDVSWMNDGKADLKDTIFRLQMA